MAAQWRWEPWGLVAALKLTPALIQHVDVVIPQGQSLQRIIGRGSLYGSDLRNNAISGNVLQPIPAQYSISCVLNNEFGGAESLYNRSNQCQLFGMWGTDPLTSDAVGVWRTEPDAMDIDMTVRHKAATAPAYVRFEVIAQFLMGFETSRTFAPAIGLQFIWGGRALFSY